jgi:hypothetical protein
MAKPSSSAQKSASVTLYLIEELGDARLRCDQLVRYINDAVKLIDKSPKKDHFFEEAGHLIKGIPAAAFKLEKSLQAVALAAGKLDYEELKQELRPEKVQQLEKVLEEVRIRPVHRRSEPQGPACSGTEPITMNPKKATEAIQELAKKTREAGSLPTTEVLGLITELEAGVKTASDDFDPSDMLDRIASALASATPEQKLSRVRLAGLLRRLVADSMVQELLSEGSLKEAAEEVVSPDILVEEMLSAMKMVARSAGVGRWRAALLQLTGIVDGIGNLLAQMGDEGALQKTRALVRDVMQAARMAQRMSPEDMVPVMAGDKIAVDPMRAMERMLDTTKDQLKEMEHSFKLLERDPGKNAPQKDNFVSAVNFLMSAGRMFQRNLGKMASEEEETKESRFEEGKPADPTRNMSPEDAKKWKSNTDKYEDKFKGASEEEEVKESKFEKGKPADPTRNMSPEDAKKWKDHVDEDGSNIKKAFGVGAWYRWQSSLSYDPSTIYYYPFETLKNGGYRCMSMEVGSSGRTRGKPKLTSLNSYDLRNFEAVRESEVPSKVTSKVLPEAKKYVERKQKEEAETAEKLEKVKNITPSAKISKDELRALAIMMTLKPVARGQYFQRAGLGEYGVHNIHIAALIKRGIVKNRGGAVVVDKKKAIKAFVDNKDLVAETDFGTYGLPYSVKDQLREASWKA